MPPVSEVRIKTAIEGSNITWTPKDGEPVTRVIDEQLFAQPNPLTRSLCLWTYNGWKQRAYSRIYNIAHLSSMAIGRPLAQEELNALVEYQTRQVLTSRLGIPLGFTAVMVHSYYDLRKINRLRPKPEGGVPEGRGGWIGQTWEIIKKPLFRPGAAEPWEREMSKAFFRTALARWFFYPLSCFALTSTWATMTYAWATAKDSRLKGWMKDLDAFRQKGMRERIQAVNEHYQEKQQQGQAQGTGSSWEPDLTESSGDYQSTGTATSMETPSTGDWKPQTLPDQSYNQQQQQQPYRYPREPEPTKPGDFFDDASPVAPDYQTESPPQTYGSAWERIRQQNMAGGLNQPQPRLRPQPVSETQRFDDYGSSKEREREQAKAEFEKMLDAERNMSNDSSGRDGVW